MDPLLSPTSSTFSSPAETRPFGPSRPTDSLEVLRTGLSRLLAEERRLIRESHKLSREAGHQDGDRMRHTLHLQARLSAVVSQTLDALESLDRLVQSVPADQRPSSYQIQRSPIPSLRATATASTETEPVRAV